MRIIKIPKKRGKYRTIYVPNRGERANLRRNVLPLLNELVKKHCLSSVVHGFMPGRNIVTNAMPHVGYAITITADLKDFFDSVTPEHVDHVTLPDRILKYVFVDGAPRQGLPTSPAVANLAARGLDDAILVWARKNKLDIVYTRYADDLAISCNNDATRDMILQALPELVRKSNFQLADGKTKIQYARTGRRIITGVAVDRDGVHPTRESKRKLRAARHQQSRSAGGLAEWVKCKIPKVYQSELEYAWQHVSDGIVF